MPARARPRRLLPIYRDRHRPALRRQSRQVYVVSEAAAVGVALRVVAGHLPVRRQDRQVKVIDSTIAVEIGRQVARAREIEAYLA